ncbi:MAG TPA: hypothetical protein VHL11_07215 [Phototrophicaceae bacterium]|jgi:hypothetical protein|nr:hypothetical protein [Phototrophicaceae bacterium]
MANESRGPVLLPLLLVVVGVLLLLHNFLLLGDFNVVELLPLVLVVIGAQVLLRGDIFAGGVKTFGITRGSVESGTLEISAAEIDVDMRALQREGRLIAGQFAAESRPQLQVDGNHATLRFLRSDTPWYAFADWQIALARDLPWQIFISTHLGQVNADFAGLIMQEALIATGLGDIRLVCPQEALGTIQVRSALGTIHIVTPPGYASRIMAKNTRTFGVKFDETRYDQVEAGVYEALDADDDAPLIKIQISGTFGDAYLA